MKTTVFDSSFIDQLKNNFSNIPNNQRPSVFYLCTSPDFANDLIYIEETWQEITSKFKSPEFNEWFTGVRSIDDSQFWSFWFHFQLYGWLKKYGEVIPAPAVRTKNQYHPDFTFSNQGIDFTIEARIFPIQGNDSKVQVISNTIIDILSTFKSKYWIDFEIFGFNHVTNFENIEKKVLNYEITRFLENWIRNDSTEIEKELTLPNCIKVKFSRQERNEESNFSWSGEIMRKIPLHKERFIKEIEKKMMGFSSFDYSSKNNLIAILLKNSLETSYDFILQIFANNRSDSFINLLKNIDGFLLFNEYFDVELKRGRIRGTFVENKFKSIHYDPKKVFPGIDIVDINGFYK